MRVFNTNIVNKKMLAENDWAGITGTAQKYLAALQSKNG